jgi:hypothetical protein
MSQSKESASLSKRCSRYPKSNDRKTRTIRARGRLGKLGQKIAGRERSGLVLYINKDFDFISREITYGFYLSDHSILTPLETELVTLAGIMIQNLPLPTAWHLRGTRRVGVSKEDVELVQQCVCFIPDF